MQEIKALIIVLSLSLCSIISNAQNNGRTLSDCIDYALEHNTSLKVAESGEESAKAEVDKAKDAFIPSVGLSNQHSLSVGRVLDPTTYDFVENRSVYDMNGSIGASETIFSGFSRFNTIKKAELNLQNASLDIEKTRNDITLNVIASFLDIVICKENIAICENKASMLRRQEEAIAKKVENKSATVGDLLSIQADIANDQSEMVEVCKSLSKAKISMCEILEIDEWESFDISLEDEDYENVEPHLFSIQDVEAAAFELPQIRSSQLSIGIAERDVKIAEASYWPSLSLNAGYGSTFSNARSRSFDEPYSFKDQFRDNTSSYVTLSLSIPLTNAISVSRTVRQRKAELKQAEYRHDLAKTSLSSEIKQAIVDAEAAYSQYEILETNVAKCEESLRQMEKKYDAGAATYYDYQTALGNLFGVQIQQVRAKFEYIFRCKIIDLYCNHFQ